MFCYLNPLNICVDSVVDVWSITAFRYYSTELNTYTEINSTFLFHLTRNYSTAIITNQNGSCRRQVNPQTLSSNARLRVNTTERHQIICMHSRLPNIDLLTMAESLNPRVQYSLLQMHVLYGLSIFSVSHVLFFYSTPGGINPDTIYRNSS